MITVLEYLVIAAAVGAVVFFLAVVVFGRGERMAPLPAQTSPAELPDASITGADIRAVKFSLALRGYRMSDVDWTLEKLAARIDELLAQLPAGAAEPAEHPLVFPDIAPGAGSDASHPDAGLATTGDPAEPTELPVAAQGVAPMTR